MPDTGATSRQWGDNSLLPETPGVWDRLIEAVGPASILVVIESRMGERLKRQVTPEDIFQEALLRAWRSRRDLEWRGVKSFRSWLLTIVDHCISDSAEHHQALKRGGAGRTAVFSEIKPATQSENASEFAGPIQTTTPSRVVIYTEQAQAMRAALDELPEDVREVVRLRLFEDLTMAQIAERLAIGLSAARHRFRRGAELYRQKLMRQLTSRCVSVSEGAAHPGTDSASRE